MRSDQQSFTQCGILLLSYLKMLTIGRLTVCPWNSYTFKLKTE